MFIYKYSQLENRVSYDEMEQLDCPIYKQKKMHLGQLKLLISEIMFLTKKAKKGNKVVYVGAAEGYHTAYLADMFPDLSFDLWDKSKFDLKSRPNIKLFKNFFTDKDANNYSKQGNNILFISDIRNLKIGIAKSVITQSGLSKYDQIINEDNNKQMKWVQTINPIAAFLKFRPPFMPGEIQYLTGKIYLQAYSPLSTETRLMTNNYKTLKPYDNTEFDEKLAYFNCYIRPNVDKLTKWKDIMKKHDIVYNWDNIYAFYVISYYLDKKKGITSEEEVVKKFEHIIKFLGKKYGKKYDVIYEPGKSKIAKTEKESSVFKIKT